VSFLPELAGIRVYFLTRKDTPPFSFLKSTTFDKSSHPEANDHNRFVATYIPNQSDNHLNGLTVYCQISMDLTIFVLNLILLDIGVIRSPAC
jgi:hypothetical protein